jgi:uncharacterized protein
MLSPVGPRRTETTSHTRKRIRNEPGVFFWLGLATSDQSAATAFYTEMFGWQSERLPASELGTYTALRLDGRDVAILYRQTREARAARAAPHWTPFVSVENVDVLAGRARELGGALLREPLDFVGAGRVAALRDPAGGILSLLQPRADVGSGLVDRIGGLCWHELVSADVDRAKSFYGELLGWEYEAGSSGLTTITNAGRRVGTIRELRGAKDVTAGWIPYFGVGGAKDAAAKVERNGGRILTASAEGPIGRTALLADPQGVTFGVLEQTVTSVKTGT